jgi:hypothetical protein
MESGSAAAARAPATSLQRPYAFLYQNTIEAWLYGSTTVLLSLMCIYAEAEASIALEVAMLIVLLGSLFGAVVHISRYHTGMG